MVLSNLLAILEVVSTNVLTGLSIAFRIFRVLLFKFIYASLRFATYYFKTRDRQIPYSKLQFHEVHGKNIQLKDNGTVARRVFRSFDNGIVFSQLPVPLGVEIGVKVLEVQPDYAGRLIFGFTSINPVKLNSEKLDQICNIKERPARFWIESMHVSELGRSRSLRYCCLPTGVMVCKTTDGIEHRMKLRGVDLKGPLWAFLHVYGSVGSISLRWSN